MIEPAELSEAPVCIGGVLPTDCDEQRWLLWPASPNGAGKLPPRDFRQVDIQHYDVRIKLNNGCHHLTSRENAAYLVPLVTQEQR